MNSLNMAIQRNSDRGLIGLALLFGAVLTLSIGSLGPNLVLSAMLATSLVSGVLLLWRPYDSPILLVIFLFQWLQASMSVFRASFLGIPVDELYDIPGAFSEAIVLSHISLVAMAVGMRFVVGRATRAAPRAAHAQIANLPMNLWLKLYVVFWGVNFAANFGASLVPGLSQIFLGMINLKWGIFFIIGMVHFAQPKKSGYWFYLIFALELMLGLGSFFSDFKTVFIVTFMSMIAAGMRITPRWALLSVGLVASATYMGILWTAIKGEYRSYVTQGSVTQSIQVSQTESMSAMVRMASSVDAERFSEATDELAERLSYIKFFGATLEYVPTQVPHENGSLSMDAISRPFMPRVFFPSKSIIDDSVRTAYYTGLEISGRERGTSISLGWVAELYIDFGKWFLPLAAMALGAFYGFIHRYLLNWRESAGIIGVAFSTSILIGALFLETSLTKVFGGVIASLIATWLVIKFFMPIVAPELVRKR